MGFARIILTGAISIVMSLTTIGSSISEYSLMNNFIVEGEYEDVRYDLDDAIVSRGLTVDHISRVSDMLQRTAGVVDGAKQIYKKAELFQFCSAKLSRAAMQANPANIVFCPYMIFMYELMDEPGKIHIGYRKLDEVGSEQSITALNAVNVLLKDIITEVSGN
jgi:uncharacterized protein (DUF302 family)